LLSSFILFAFSCCLSLASYDRLLVGKINICVGTGVEVVLLAAVDIVGTEVILLAG